MADGLSENIEAYNSGKHKQAVDFYKKAWVDAMLLGVSV